MVLLFKINKILVLLFAIIAIKSNAQDNTRTATQLDSTGKVLIIPFEPIMYWSEMDKKINEQTKWKFEQIREFFRKQLDLQFQSKFKTNYKVISFYNDSVKMCKDLDYIYKSTNLTYDPIDKPSSPLQANVAKKQIKEGQIKTESSGANQFMNIKINDTEMLSYLHKKYGANYILFVNQLDIKSLSETYSLETDSYQREVTLHYSLIDYQGKIMVAGIATARFSSKENNPKKIVQQCFGNIASSIKTAFYTKLNPKTQAAQK
jgi:hypothetical protein